MYKSSYNCEKAIKRIAKVYSIICYVLLAISFIALQIALVDFDDLLILGIVSIAVAVISLLGLLVVPFMWGFGDIVGNLGRLSNQSSNNNEEFTSEELPEL